VSLAEELDAHYRTHIGANPIRWGEPGMQPPPVSLHEWNAEANLMRIHFYASYGMSLAALRGSIAHGVELYSGVASKSDRFRDALVALASNARDSGIILRDTQILDQQKPVIVGLAFTGWIFFDRSPELLPDLALSNGCHIKFLDAAPLFAQEIEHARSNGVNALFDVWNAEEVEVWNHERSLSRLLGSAESP
jgi:hypothetical protein